MLAQLARPSAKTLLTLVCLVALPLAACDPKSDKADAASQVADVAADAAADAGSIHASPDGSGDGTVTCPGQAGCPCSSNADCDAGLCVDSDQGRVCAAECVDICPAGWSCVAAGAGADVVSYCVPTWGLLCRPCQSAKDCEAAGVSQAACVDHGGAGGFCGASCASDDHCPTGHVCKAAKDVSSASVKQCVPAGDGPGGMGLCGCSKTAVDRGLGTTCWLESEGLTCKGSRACGDSGLSACEKLTGAGAECFDAQCAGKPDGTACDDGEPCTDKDTCAQGVCKPGTLTCACASDADCLQLGPGGEVDKCAGTRFCDKSGATPECKTNPATVVSCATSKDTDCRKNSCDPKTGTCDLADVTKGASCDDGDACTTDEVCDGKGGCASDNKVCCTTTADCAKFEDGDPCNGTLYCDLSAGKNTCVVNPASAIECPSVGDTACVKNTCDPKTSLCVPKAVPDKTACDDGVLCTIGEVCEGGACLASPAAHVCACAKDADCAAKDDGDLCNGTLFCNAAIGKCQQNPATVVSCPSVDDTACTQNTCEPKTGKCAPTALPDGVTCDADSNACTQGDSCVAGVCKVGTQACQCQSNADCAQFEDGNLCNGTLYCFKSGTTASCKVNPATVKSCPTVDDTACVKNLCQPKTGVCSKVSLPDGTPCEDGVPCSVHDSCSQGTCKSGAAGCPCQVAADCAKFYDGNPCTDMLCDAKTGCTLSANSKPCTDGDACTTGDQCSGGACKSSGKLDCDDDNPCTLDGCQDGCIHQALADGTSCGGPGTCAKGLCACGPKQWFKSPACVGCDCDLDGTQGTATATVTLQNGAKVPPALEGDGVGTAISGSGGWLAVSLPGDDPIQSNSGSVAMLKRGQDGAWAYHSIFTGSRASHLDSVGTALELEGDRLMVGSWGDDNAKGSNAGVVYEFRLQKDGTWKETATLIEASGMTQIRLGWSLDLEGTRIVIGAPYINYTTGRAYIWEAQPGGAWKQMATLLPTGIKPSTKVGGGFGAQQQTWSGYSVALSGERAAVGVPWDATMGQRAGKVVIFERVSATSWSQKAAITAPGPKAEDLFGTRLALAGDELVAGVHDKSMAAGRTGAVFVFKRDSKGAWPPVQTLAPAGLAVDDHFGSDLSLDGDVLLVGAPLRASKAGAAAGAVYVYRRDQAKGWQLQAELAGTVAGGKLGHAVDVATAAGFAGMPGAAKATGDYRRIGLWDFLCDAKGQCPCKPGASGLTCAGP